jgi:hypothetical protein
MMTIDQLVVFLVGVGEILVGGTLVGVTTESLKCTGELSSPSWIALWTKQVEQQHGYGRDLPHDPTPHWN